MGDLLRLLDANFNRAREALRVLEDLARFRYDDIRTRQVLRAARHQVGEMERSYGRALLASRDSVRDVGRASPTEARSDERAMAAANFKRAQEALRVLEECGVRGAAELRFLLYDLEKESEIRRRLSEVRLYVLLDSGITRRPLERVMREAMAGGAQMFQLRESGCTDRELLSRASRLARLARNENVLFIVNNRADIARAAGADGVHVGQKDLPIAEARLVPMVGATSHSLAEAKEAVREGADYVSVGPMVRTALKPHLSPRGADYLAGVKRLGVPFFCIGGITATTVQRSMERVAVCTGVIGQPDVRAAARAIRAKLPR